MGGEEEGPSGEFRPSMPRIPAKKKHDVLCVKQQPLSNVLSACFNQSRGGGASSQSPSKARAQKLCLKGKVLGVGKGTANYMIKSKLNINTMLLILS